MRCFNNFQQLKVSFQIRCWPFIRPRHLSRFLNLCMMSLPLTWLHSKHQILLLDTRRGTFTNWVLTIILQIKHKLYRWKDLQRTIHSLPSQNWMVKMEVGERWSLLLMRTCSPIYQIQIYHLLTTQPMTVWVSLYVSPTKFGRVVLEKVCLSIHPSEDKTYSEYLIHCLGYLWNFIVIIIILFQSGTTSFLTELWAFL